MSTPSLEHLDIHKNLRDRKTSWGHLHAVGPHQADANYEFITSFIGETEYALYARQGNYFVLVDSFKNYEEANHSAKEIINNQPQLKNLFKVL